MRTLQKSNLQITSTGQGMTFVANSNWSPTSAMNDRYVCACSAE